MYNVFAPPVKDETRSPLLLQDTRPELIGEHEYKKMDWRWHQRRTALTFLLVFLSAFLDMRIMFTVLCTIFLYHVYSNSHLKDTNNALKDRIKERVDACFQRFPFPVYGREPLRRLGEDGDPRNCWSEPPGSLFFLRSKTYLTDQMKQEAGTPYCTCVRGSFFIHRSKKILHMAQIPFIRSFLEAHPDQQFIIYSRYLVVDGKIVHVFHIYARTSTPGERPHVDALWDRFFAKGKTPEEVAAIQDFRKKRFKYICNITQAPSSISCFMASIGGTRPALLGHTIGLNFYDGPNYVEVAMDAAGNSMAKVITTYVASYFSTMVIDEMVLLEAQTEDELPEEPLFAFRFNFCDLRGVMRDFPLGEPLEVE